MWSDRVRDQQSSGQSVASYCAEHALGASSFYLWRKRLAEAPSPAPFVEVITGSTTSIAGSHGVIEIVLPDGLTVRLDAQVPMARLREIIAVLRESGSAEVGS